MAENESWAVVELMGHVSIAGRVNKPGEYGGLWQVDVPEGESFRTEFFGSQSVYRIRIVSEEIARAYALPAHAILEYNAPIVTREEHLNALERAQDQYHRVQRENEELRRRLTAVNALPSGLAEQDESEEE
jgi:Thiol:disulfide interchange protein